LNRLNLKSRTPREFVLEWDEYLNRTHGIQVVERQREIVMAANLLKLPKEYKRILALVEVERFQGVVKNLEKVLGEEG
jgi:hypothetical protein